MSLIKHVESGKPAKEKIIDGINICAEAIGSTMGARGQLVLIETDGSLPKVTKDGYSVLKSIYLDSPLEALGAELLKEAAQKTVDEAGDASSCTVVLAQEFINLSQKAIANGKSQLDIKNEIEASIPKVLAYLEWISIPLTDKLIYDVALTSSNGDEKMAKIVSEAFIQAGENGSVAHFRSNTDDDSLEYKEGTLVESGYSDELFINQQSDRTAVLDKNPLVIISHIEFKTFNEIQPFLDFAVDNKRQIVIISEMHFAVRNVILQNKVKGFLDCVVITPPSIGKKRKDILTDLALTCNTNMISTLDGSYFVGRTAGFLGEAKSVICNANDTIILPSDNMNKEKVESKISELKEISDKSKNQLEKKYLADRVSKLSGGVSLIKIGGLTEAEIGEKMDRCEDAVFAIRAAKEEGVVAGGGVALFSTALNFLGRIDTIDEITRMAISKPYFKILSNADLNIQKPIKQNWIDKLLKRKIAFGTDIDVFPYPIGYNVKTYEKVNMLDAGIVDVTKAIRNAYLNAVSVSNTISRINYTITNKIANNE